MTKRTRKRPVLKRLRRQAVELDFDGGTLTSDGGLVLLREVDRRLDLIRRIDEAIPELPPDALPHKTITRTNISHSQVPRRTAGLKIESTPRQFLNYTKSLSILSWTVLKNLLKRLFLTTTLPTTPSTASKTNDTSTGSMTAIAFFRCMFFAATKSSFHTFVPAV
ncbi:hypothetical protein Poly41_09430 [Novipirellula artificiosorum]|uniref:Transposase DDE domain-containing protein n=1 Tax=Novipirellula artificiosorum TaxID=2528016 RepID=A0A5C6E2C6_9BACT|nr:hypothetical protein Poly41_09430 [Novipirellula artificiosorum]